MNQNKRSILETAGLRLKVLAFAGWALLPATSDAATGRKPNVIIFYTDDQGALDANKVMHWHFEERWAVREGDWKLISAPHGEPDFLGNLADDEPERKNYLKEEPELAEKLFQLHSDWIKQVMPKKN